MRVMREATRGSDMTQPVTARSPADDYRPFKVSEGKELAGIGLNQMYAGIRRGEIPSIRVGNRILLPRRAFLAWLDGNRPNAA